MIARFKQFINAVIHGRDIQIRLKLQQIVRLNRSLRVHVSCWLTTESAFFTYNGTMSGTKERANGERH